MDYDKRFVRWDTLAEDIQFFQQPENLETGILAPFIAISNPLTNEELQKTIVQTTLNTPFLHAKPIMFSFSDRKPDKEKLKLGFVSGDFRNHPVGYVLGEFFELIDREKFDVYLYDTHPEEQTDIHKRIWGTTPNVIAIDKNGVAFKHGTVQAGDVYVDGNRIGEVGNAVMKDRKIMATDGIVVVIANIDTVNNVLLNKPNITTRGFVLVNDNQDLINDLENIAAKAINSKLKGHLNYSDIKNEIVSELVPYIYEKTGRKPIILPVIMNIKKDVKVNS